MGGTRREGGLSWRGVCLGGKGGGRWAHLEFCGVFGGATAGVPVKYGENRIKERSRRIIKHHHHHYYTQPGAIPCMNHQPLLHPTHVFMHHTRTRTHTLTHLPLSCPLSSIPSHLYPHAFSARLPPPWPQFQACGNQARAPDCCVCLSNCVALITVFSLRVCVWPNVRCASPPRAPTLFPTSIHPSLPFATHTAARQRRR